ncbi:hypothetical protein MHU86_2098 [Fragilaria crotonensis]|nr:hypothetical protein MHU86_2098 [Fragilaria crotonensis]
MYGGLFGDLPSAKGSEKKGEAPSEASVQAPPDSRQQSAGGPPYVLSGLGNAGTAMAFIPTAIRPRKRPKQSTIKSKTNATVPTGTVLKRLDSPLASTEDDGKKVVVQDARNDQKGFDIVSSRVESWKDEAQTVVSGIQVNPEEFRFEPARDETLSEGQMLSVDTAVGIKQEESESRVISNIHEVLSDQRSTPLDEPGLEDEALQKLHASVTDPYDPHVPNDLLSYRERQEMERERQRLERDVQETLERQQQLRRQLEDERQRVQSSGRASDIIDHRTKVSLLGGGRGRGVNNLPAWLLQKQKDELGAAASVKNVDARTVILSNLTTPGDIDVELGVEVQEECEELCGPVEGVEVKDAQPPHQPEVQVWVQFRNIGDAKKAAALFHGRMFGRRRITARQRSE